MVGSKFNSKFVTRMKQWVDDLPKEEGEEKGVENIYKSKELV